MKSEFYTYCLLKYKHSPYLDESINVGVLIYFSATDRFAFKYSKTLGRVKNIYDKVPEKTIREYLRQIDSALKRYGGGNDTNIFPLNDTNLKDFLSKNILPHDGSVLQFGHFRTEIDRGFSESLIESSLFENLFIEDFKSSHYQQQEPKLLHNLFENLKQRGLNRFRHHTNRFQEDVTLTNQIGTEFKFDLKWVNGTVNYVKPIGFDLKTPDGITEKAQKNLGQFTDLGTVANNVKFHLIVGEPTTPGLSRVYDRAIKTLEKIDGAVLIPEKELPTYSGKVITALELGNI